MNNEISSADSILYNGLKAGDAVACGGNNDSLRLKTLSRLGYKTYSTTQDLRLWSLPKSGLDAAIWENADATYKLEDAQRVLQIFFSALKSKHPLLLETQGEKWAESGLLALIRQSGFDFKGVWKNKESKTQIFWCVRL